MYGVEEYLGHSPLVRALHHLPTPLGVAVEIDVHQRHSAFLEQRLGCPTHDTRDTRDTHDTHDTHTHRERECVCTLRSVLFMDFTNSTDSADTERTVSVLPHKNFLWTERKC